MNGTVIAVANNVVTIIPVIICKMQEHFVHNPLAAERRLIRKNISDHNEFDENKMRESI